MERSVVKACGNLRRLSTSRFPHSWLSSQQMRDDCVEIGVFLKVVRPPSSRRECDFLRSRLGTSADDVGRATIIMDCLHGN